MPERWRDSLVLLLLVACAAGTYATAQITGTHEPLPIFLPLISFAAFYIYKVACLLLGRWAAAPPRIEFSFPVYLLRDSTGLVLCTDEPNGGHLAVFTSLDAAGRFREIRNISDWSPEAFSHVELLDVLQSAKHSGRVQYVMIDPRVSPYGLSQAFPLSRCIERLGG
jgi:hypothetical protein